MNMSVRFSPELLGVQASSALVWLIMEVLAVLLSLYLVTVNTELTTIDLLAFSGYKYVGYVLVFSTVSVIFSLLYCKLTITLSLFLQNDFRHSRGSSIWKAGVLSLSAVVLRRHFCLYGGYESILVL